MVDGVKLILLHEPLEMRKLHGNDASWFEQDFHSSNKIIEVRHLREDVVAEEQISSLAGGREFACCFRAKELDESRNAFLNRDSSDVCRGFDSQYRYLLLDKVLQQVAIVARHFYDEALLANGETLHHLIGVLVGMRKPRV